MKTTIFLSMFAALSWVGFSARAEKSYSVDAIRIAAEVASDGSMRVTEVITYRFDGRFSYAYRDIPIRSGEKVIDVSVREKGAAFARSDNEEPGTFKIGSGDGGPRVTWYYDARDEERTFEFSYTVSGLVRRYPDTAEICYKFVGEGWDREIGRVDVDVRLPEAARTAGVRAWAHGPLHGTVSILPGGSVALNVAPLPARTFWEGRILCESAAFPDLVLSGGNPRLAAILEEETRWADEANRLREERTRRRAAALREREERAARGRQFLPVSVVAGLGALGAWLMFFLRHGRPHDVVPHLAPGNIPSGHAPAIVSYLMYRTAGGPAVTATLLDLASRGHLEVHESAVTTKGLFGKTRREMDYRFDVVAADASDLAPFEESLLRFVRTEAGDEKGFSILALRKAATKKHMAFHKFFVAWSKEVAECSRPLQFFEPYPVGAMLANALCGAGILGAGVAMSALTVPIVGVPAIAGGFIQAILTVSLTRRTPEGRRLMLAWKAFKKHLKSLSRSMAPMTMGSREWGRYLGAAVIFGMHRKLIPVLRVHEGNGAYPVWFYGAASSGGDGGIAGLATGISSMVSVVSSTASSAAGAGGGASGGGGGGSGGGGGGAG
jgi:uncharacterized membrane protein